MLSGGVGQGVLRPRVFYLSDSIPPDLLTFAGVTNGIIPAPSRLTASSDITRGDVETRRGFGGGGERLCQDNDVGLQVPR